MIMRGEREGENILYINAREMRGGELLKLRLCRHEPTRRRRRGREAKAYAANGSGSIYCSATKWRRIRRIQEADSEISMK